MNTFSFTYKSITLDVVYGKKDFSATYNSIFGEMTYHLHMMFMCPKVYSEEMLRKDYCPEIAEEFIKTEAFLNEHPDFIEEKKAILSEQMAKLETEKIELQRKRSESRKLLKEGKVSQIEHSKVCKTYNEADYKLSVCKSDFYRKLKNETGIDFRYMEGAFYDR